MLTSSSIAGSAAAERRQYVLCRTTRHLVNCVLALDSTPYQGKHGYANTLPPCLAIDLVQLSRIPGAVGGNPCYPYCGPLFESFGEVAFGGVGGVMLADVDLSGRVTERDFDKFMDSWLEEAGSAGDYVRDSVYDEADVAAFLTDYIEALQ
ncbi:MAG: hypothetical protein KF864_06440 [Phycisphaeraceae bacterium]|nr:hypothetical protein [Phycisphaeraceae bacterium]